MVTLNSADKALKSFYLQAITDSLDTKANPFLAKIQKTSNNVTGKDVVKLVRLGINGGISAGTETGDLPTATGNKYVQFKATLKNLYGTLEISDKAVRASANNEGAFVNLLNDEMEGLVKSANYNFGRMLFGNGQGLLATVTSVVDEESLKLSSLKNLAEGMVVDIVDAATKDVIMEKLKVESINHENKSVFFVGVTKEFTNMLIPAGTEVYLHGAKDNELTGLNAIFNSNILYGSARTNSLMRPYVKTSVGQISENIIQEAIDSIEATSGGKVNFIICSWGVRRALLEYYKEFKVIPPSVTLECGTQAISFNGIPVVVDRFCPDGTMYLLNTEDFKLHQLCDWQWIEAEDGKILKQVPGKPVYTATLVKYAELMCEKPCGQGMLADIKEA